MRPHRDGTGTVWPYTTARDGSPEPRRLAHTPAGPAVRAPRPRPGRLGDAGVDGIAGAADNGADSGLDEPGSAACSTTSPAIPQESRARRQVPGPQAGRGKRLMEGSCRVRRA
jgi:hypothetical protein